MPEVLRKKLHAPRQGCPAVIALLSLDFELLALGEKRRAMSESMGQSLEGVGGRAAALVGSAMVEKERSNCYT